MTENRIVLWTLLCASSTFRGRWIIGVLLYAVLGGPLVFWIGSVVEQHGAHGPAAMIGLAAIYGYLWMIEAIVMWLVAVAIAWM